MISLKVNGKSYTVEVSQDTPLLWVIRDHLGLTGTKFGCGMAQCGACSVLLEGKVQFSCQVPIEYAVGKEITTIEGIAEDHPVKQAWVAEDVPQCGYCQSGQIMNAVALLQDKPSPTDEDINEGMSGCLCRCGTYQRIRRAIHRAANVAKGEKKHG